MSIPQPWRATAFAEKRPERPVGGAEAGGICTFPRAGGRLGWGSNAGTALAEFRPPRQPVLQTAPSQRLGPAAGVLGPQDPNTSGRSPCPGEGAKSSAAGNSDAMRNFTMQNDLFLMSRSLFELLGIVFGGVSGLTQAHMASRDKQNEREHWAVVFDKQIALQSQRIPAETTRRARTQVSRVTAGARPIFCTRRANFRSSNDATLLHAR